MDKDLPVLIRAIVAGQQQIIGPLAIDQANKVSGLTISTDLKTIKADGKPEEILKNLVNQFEQLFGQASIEACKEAVKKILPQVTATNIPDFLH